MLDQSQLNGIVKEAKNNFDEMNYKFIELFHPMSWKSIFLVSSYPGLWDFFNPGHRWQNCRKKGTQQQSSTEKKRKTLGTYKGVHRE
jgi:hypothetical protein